jgi:hypothetical protein
VVYNLTGFNFSSTTVYTVGQTLEVTVKITTSVPTTFNVVECYTVIPYNSSLPNKPTDYVIGTTATCGVDKCANTYVGLKECDTNNTFLSSAPIPNLSAQTYNVSYGARIPTLLPIGPTYLNGHEFSAVCFQIIAPQTTLSLGQTGIIGDEWIQNENGFLRIGSVFPCSSTNCSDCRSGTTLVNIDDVSQTITYSLCNGTTTSSTIPAQGQITQSACINVVSFMNNTPSSGQVFFSGGTTC